MQGSDGKLSHNLLALSKVKQYLPYESIHCVADLENRNPLQQDFTSTLGVGKIMMDSEYLQFKTCWNTLKVEKYGSDMTMRDYLGFYNALDVILLSEVHLSFRKLLHEQYKVSPDW